MEYKKVEKCIRRDDTRQRNFLLKVRNEKRNISKTAVSKSLSIERADAAKNIEGELRTKEEIVVNSNDKTSLITYKDATFEYEDEWDIGGIPELLSELDADIEKSLKNIQNTKFDGIKKAINIKSDILKPLQSKHCGIQKLSNNFNSTESAQSLKISKNTIALGKNILASTFTGFSKRGSLISSNSSNSSAICSLTADKSCGRNIKPTKTVEKQGCTVSMSSQAGSNGNTSSNIGASGINTNCCQSNSGSNNSNKLNNKMSIDHQATLDKGLKMKIKRTKPGTKSLEAKHEIVKATEQQQNGLGGSAASVCSTTQEDISCLLSNQSVSSNAQNSNTTSGINNSQGISNLTGNKKILGSGNNQNNLSSTSGNISISSIASNTALSQGTKRGSSGHRRDKTKDKSSHSNRMGVDKNPSVNTEKDSAEKSLCHSTVTDGSASTCSHSSCNQKTENTVLTQRLATKNACGNIMVVPPGVFTPSTDTSASAVVSNLLLVTTAISTSVCTQTMSTGINASTTGSPSKEISTNNGGSVKISSHIAAQLAAAAASHSSTNLSSITSSSFPSTELKPSLSEIQSQIVKQISPVLKEATVNHSIPGPIFNQKTLADSATVCPDNSTTKSLKNENSQSPPAKRAKQAENKATIPTLNKEMVDVCIGTSIGTITEPDCLGPCEPGTSVTLEGIVWHETEGGVLVVNVTWRGKTYVGTLLDCTRHDWAPPRFCDSPTEDLDARTPKGRGKRGRASITPDLSNFTETRSSIYFSHSHVHSKLRNGSTKGGRGTSRTISGPVDKANCISHLSLGNSGATPSTSPTAFLPPRAEKRKSKDESPPPVCADSEALNNNGINAIGIPMSLSSGSGLTSQPQSLINPVTGLNVQISTKKCKSSLASAISPVLLECPENDCSKKYKHINGLRYHQSHAHGSASILDEDSMAETEEHITPQPSPQSSTPNPFTPNPSDLVPNTQMSTSSPPEAHQISEEKNTKNFKEEELSQHLEHTEDNFKSNAVLSLTCEDILSSAVSISTTPMVPSTSEIITDETIHQPEQLKQFIGLAENNKINISNEHSLESNNQTTGKSGVLRYGQVDVKNNIISPNEIMFQSDSLEASSPIKCVAVMPESNNVTFCAVSLEKKTHLQQNDHISSTDETSAMTSVALKPKKERKSPSINDYESAKLSICNVSSRDDVKSPAYSDISDDSNPLNDSVHTEKVDVSKHSDIVNKSQDPGLSISTNCPSSQSNMCSTLSSYGVYQFYQQQQFIVPSAVETQQSGKNTLNSNMGSTIISPSLTQQQLVSEFSSKKDSPVDKTSKANLNQPHSNQHCQEINKDTARTICVTGDHSNTESVGSSASNSNAPKSVSHFYAFNYMPSNYSFNIDHNFGPGGSMMSSENSIKPTRLPRISSPGDQSQQPSPAFCKEDRPKEERNLTDSLKSANLQIASKQALKSDSVIKSDCIKQESICTSLSQISHHMQQGKEHPGIGTYANMYQRHPMALATQQLSREEELRRYYILSDQQRRHNSASNNAMNQQVQNTSPQTGNQQCKDDTLSQQLVLQNQQQIKIKGNTSVNVNKFSSSTTGSKESPKHKQEEELKVIKQEGQKPTMETQGPPPPPTSQYFLHPSYITSSPFGFDPSHAMYRNVLMPATSPYNTPPYHMPMPRYHNPEDLSRNNGTKALDALHHAASQYYTTHKIHELSERALKSPNNSTSSNASGTIKTSGSSPNIGTSQHSSMGSNIIGHHAVQNQSSSLNQIPHNLSSQSTAGKQDIVCQKAHGISPGVAGTSSESQKPLTTGNSPAGGCNNGSNTNNVNTGSTSDSRSPPPQRHVHTHHHTHVGLGYPMYPSPYGAAVLASQQAAAVAVINPFSPGPNK